MSHFAVLVIGDDPEKQLAPYHEFECTGNDDQYVQDLDITDECRKEFKSSTESMVRLSDGTVVSYYDYQFYRNPTPEELKEIGPLAGTGMVKGVIHTSKDWGDGKGYRAKIHFIPDGAEAFQQPRDDFIEWLDDYHGKKAVPHGQQPDLEDDHKYGYALLNEAGEVVKVIDRTNPNKKWDWYQVGGRWSGFLKLKAGCEGGNGKRSWMNRNDLIGAGYCDQATKGSIDFDAMRDKAGMEAAEAWDKAYAVHQGQTWEPWKVVGPRTNYDEVSREFYRNQPPVKALKVVFDNPFHDIDQYLTPRDEYIQHQRDKATVLFAVLKDGKWFERGEMGWWGVVHDEKDQGEWRRQFNELLDGLPDDTVLTVVDCHI